MRYTGDTATTISPQQAQTHFLFERMLQPHEKNKIKNLFGDAHDNSGAVKMQQEMFERFIEEFDRIFCQKITGSFPDTIPNETTAAPIYFYQTDDIKTTHSVGPIMIKRYKNSLVADLTNITIYLGEDKKLCDIYCDGTDKEIAIASAQQTIMSLSKKATMDINDIFKTSRGNNGPGSSGP